MKKLLLLLLLLPSVCGAQEYRSGELAKNKIADNTHDTVRRSYWQVLGRSGISNTLNAFYRISRINSDLYLDMKITAGGGSFAIARNAPLILKLENDDVVTLYNSSYQASCKGCGSRKDNDNRAQGVTLSFPMSSTDVLRLLKHYVASVSINTGNDHLERKINNTHNELLMDEIRLVHDAR